MRRADIRKKLKIEKGNKTTTVWQLSPVNFNQQISQIYTSVLLCWSSFQIFRRGYQETKTHYPAQLYFQLFYLPGQSLITYKEKEAFKTPWYANWGHRHLSGTKRRWIYCLDSWFITSASGKVEKGAILKIISIWRAYWNDFVRLAEAFYKAFVRGGSTLPQPLAPLPFLLRLL